MLCIVRVCNQLCFKDNVQKSNLYVYAVDDTLLVLACKLIVVYYQHTFYSLFK